MGTSERLEKIEEAMTSVLESDRSPEHKNWLINILMKSQDSVINLS